MRRRSGKKPGGQLGHRGETLQLVAVPDAVVADRPAACAACQAPLADDAPVVLREQRQVQDLPPLLRLHVTDHHALHVRCPACQAVSAGTLPSDVPSRAQYGPRLRALAVYLVEQHLVPYGRVRDLLADLFGVRRSRGTPVTWVQQAARTLEPVEAQIKAALAQAPVRHSDEMGGRQAGQLAWAHVASTDRLTHDGVQARRGSEATGASGILPRSAGVSVHAGWAAYRANTACRHARCHIHRLRELTVMAEQEQHVWASDLTRLLLELKAATDQARACGRARLPAAARDAFVARYEALLAAGLAANPANPPPDREPRRRGRIKQTPARHLLERLWRGREQVLAFLDDLTIPFDNTQAERDLRGLQMPQNVSGGFRCEAGAGAFARLRGYLATLRKQGQALLAALATVFAGPPLSPALV